MPPKEEKKASNADDLASALDPLAPVIASVRASLLNYTPAPFPAPNPRFAILAYADYADVNDALAHTSQSPVSSLADYQELLSKVKTGIAADQTASDTAQQEYERLRAQAGTQTGAQAPTRTARYRPMAPAQSGQVDAPTLPSSSSQGGETVAPPTQLPGLGGGPI